MKKLTLLKDLPGYPKGTSRKIKEDFKRIQFNVGNTCSSGYGYSRIILQRDFVLAHPEFFEIK